jgi:hypothetical protein
MNHAELELKLMERGVPKDAYSLSGGLPNEAYCLDHAVDKWQVYYSERDRRADSEVLTPSKKRVISFTGKSQRLWESTLDQAN